MLQDAGVLRTLIGSKKSRRGSTSSQRAASRERKPRKDKEGDATGILTLVLAEEKRQAHHLKAVLRTTGDRLESEMRRAEQAEEKARSAEVRARDSNSRATAAETARHLAELDAARAREEVARYRMMAEAAERETRRVEAERQRSDRLKNEADHAATEAKDAARKAQQTLREWQAREEGRAEGMRIEVRRRYEDGREDGFEDGRAEGYETGRTEGLEEGRAEGLHAGRTEGHAAGRLAGFDEGRQVGYDEGFREGYTQGKKEERAHALEAFDKFIDGHMDKDSVASFDEDDRTHQWVEATRSVHSSEAKHIRAPSPKPIKPPPTPTTIRDPSVPVWLHRQPRIQTPGPMIYAPLEMQA
ncbi:hypothetical protein EW026_g3555 [Hermanssonia centrifuga]|uniref:Uncharacterized protein n=1 Tax=Hermanssonia centrifuga TaxID=98765 RepID=A0A4S4KJS3_9APHY|nr:hypothetical protein EW026_g3555 [Hermanssonia centrifuga]